MINRLKEIRLSKKLTQSELAQKVGVTQGTIQKIETGHSDLSLTQMKMLSKALDCEPYELLPLEWQPQPLSDEEKLLLKLFRKKGQE